MVAGGGVLIVVVALGAAAWFGLSQPASLPAADAAAVESAADGGLTVHVSGAVVNPGLVSVPSGARIADVVSAAGGALPDADLRALNLAAPVRDGEQIAVPGRSEAVAAGGGAVDAAGRVRINRADAVELQALPGVGPVLAERILAYRDEHGPFASVEDLLDVSGIGEGKLSSLRDSVVVP
jgi:competence protein ComEA